jgi:DNA-binding beta-propeller fold protein YncE
LDTAAGRVAVADVRGNALYVFDVKTQKRVAVLPAGAGPTHVVRVGPSTVAVADTRGNAVLLYDLSGHPRQVFRLSLPGGPYGLAADPSRDRLWVALSGRNELVQVDVDVDDLRLRTTGIRIPTVQQPNSVAVSPTTGTLIVAGATEGGTLQILKPPKQYS